MLRPDAPAFVPCYNNNITPTLGGPIYDSPQSGEPNFGTNPQNATVGSKPKKKSRRSRNKKANNGDQSAVPPQQTGAVVSNGKGSNVKNSASTKDDTSKTHRKDRTLRHRQFHQKRRKESRYPFSGRARRDIALVNESVTKKNVDQEDPPVVENDAFPVLGNKTSHSEKFIFQTHENIEWVNIAATKPPPSVSQEGHSLQKERESESLATTGTGLRLTQLKKGPAASKNKDDITSRQRSLEAVLFPVLEEQEASTAERNSSLDDTVQLECGHSCTSPQGENGKEVQKRKPMRLGMTKLRDRWWNLLQQSAAKKQQQRRLELDEEQKMREVKRQDDKDALDSRSSCTSYFPSGVAMCHEYVELEPSDDRGERKDGHNRRQHSGPTVDLGQISQYACWDNPLHKAIINHDKTALELLLLAYKNKQMALKSTEITRNQLPSEVTRWSPVQLAVKVDMPDLLAVLLRAMTAEADEFRRQRLPSDREPKIILKPLLCGNAKQYTEVPTPLMLAAESAREECAQLLLSHASPSASALIACRDGQGDTPLHICCRASGHDDLQTKPIATPSLLRTMLHIVVDAGGTTSSKILSCKNNQGQTPLHVACQEGRVDLVEVFLDICSSGTLFSLLIKLFASTDIEGQTPLLAAIASGSTDLVMTLFMWKGNHHRHHMGTKQQQKASHLSAISLSNAKDSFCCPLLWAVKRSGSADMVRLLLEFHDPFPLSPAGASEDKGTYDLNYSLHEAVQRSSASGCAADLEMLEIVRVLVEAGANPCRELRERKDQEISLDKKKALAALREIHSKEANNVQLRGSQNPTAIGIVAQKGHVPTLRTLLDSLRTRMREVQESRRRDPILRKQPESFFQSLESLEDGEIKAALSDALTITLYFGYSYASLDDRMSGQYLLTSAESMQHDEAISVNARNVTSENYLEASLILYRKGARLGSNGLARLKCSLGTSLLKSIEDVTTNKTTSSPCGSGYHYDFRTGYHCEMLSFTAKNGKEYNLSLQDRSDLLHQMQWMPRLDDEYGWNFCPRMAERSEIRQFDALLADALTSDRIILLTDHGKTRLAVHGKIVSQNSAKLAAAVRFARMSHNSIRNPARCKNTLEIDLGSTPSKLCVMMLQHLYHGSLVCGLSKQSEVCCQQLLDLLLLSEEFLCPSLAQECEMRLLSSSPHQCFCWSCCHATSGHMPQKSLYSREDKVEHCIYVVEGPPKLITAETVLDVMAVAQHLSGSCPSTIDNSSYMLEFAVIFHETSSHLGVSTTRSCDVMRIDWTRLLSEKPSVGIREVATDLLMTSFAEVLQSSVYAAQVDNSLSDFIDEKEELQYKNEAPSLLLQMSLEELASSATKDSFVRHSQRSRIFRTKPSKT